MRIGVNGGSLNQELVVSKMEENTVRNLGRTSEEILNECMVISAIESTELALETGLRTDQIIISCKVSRPRDLIAIYRDLARKSDQPLHLGLTEAGMGMKGLMWSASAMGILLNEGIGDTIRVSLTPRPGGDRREEVYAACELLQALGIRAFAPSVTACPGCGRTTSSTFQELAERTQDYIREQMPLWKTTYEGVETLTLAVMGCVVNGPGESKAANIGISLPGTGEAPNCPVYIDGEHFTTLRGTYDELDEGFRALVDNYVATRFHESVVNAQLPTSNSQSQCGSWSRASAFRRPLARTATTLVISASPSPPARRIARVNTSSADSQPRRFTEPGDPRDREPIHVGVDDARMDVRLAADGARVSEDPGHGVDGLHDVPVGRRSDVPRGSHLAKRRARENGSGPGAEILGGEILAGDLAQVVIHVAGTDTAAAVRSRRDTETAPAPADRGSA